MIAWTFVTPSAVDVEGVDFAAPFHRLFELLLGFVQVPLASFQKPQQSARQYSQPLYIVIEDRKIITKPADARRLYMTSWSASFTSRQPYMYSQGGL